MHVVNSIGIKPIKIVHSDQVSPMNLCQKGYLSQTFLMNKQSLQDHSIFQMVLLWLYYRSILPLNYSFLNKTLFLMFRYIIKYKIYAKIQPQNQDIRGHIFTKQISAQDQDLKGGFWLFFVLNNNPKFGGLSYLQTHLWVGVAWPSRLFTR